MQRIEVRNKVPVRSCEAGTRKPKVISGWGSSSANCPDRRDSELDQQTCYGSVHPGETLGETDECANSNKGNFSESSNALSPTGYGKARNRASLGRNFAPSAIPSNTISSSVSLTSDGVPKISAPVDAKPPPLPGTGPSSSLLIKPLLVSQPKLTLQGGSYAARYKKNRNTEDKEGGLPDPHPGVTTTLTLRKKFSYH